MLCAGLTASDGFLQHIIKQHCQLRLVRQELVQFDAGTTMASNGDKDSIRGFQSLHCMDIKSKMCSYILKQRFSYEAKSTIVDMDLDAEASRDNFPAPLGRLGGWGVLAKGPVF